MSNTFWTPRLSNEPVPFYRGLADALERDITEGTLREGARLPTHRELAQKLGVTPLTITRAYKEAARRGLIESTVGRGTFVKSGAEPVENRGAGSFIDLGKNIVHGSDHLRLEPSMTSEIRRFVHDSEYPETPGILRHRSVAAAWLEQSGVPSAPERIVITPGAQQAILAALAALCQRGDAVLVEELTYPRFAAIASFLHLDIRPISLDGDGALPKSVEKACRKPGAKAIYLIPNFQNPTGSVMPEKRRREIAAVARRNSLAILEDDVYGFLLDKPPVSFAELLPELTCYITSTSKSVTPSLRLGFISLPDHLIEPVTSAFGATTAFTSSVAAELFTLLYENGSAMEAVVAKRLLVKANRAAAARALGSPISAAHALSPHLWLPLPPGCDARELADRARLRGIGVAPAPAFACGRNPPNGVRISIGAIRDTRSLETALRTLRGLIADPRLTPATTV